MIPAPPPRADALPAGYKLRAGLGESTVLPDLDFETISLAGYAWDDERQRWEGPPGAPQNRRGLDVVGAQRYTTDPTCEIIWLAYNLKDGRGTRRWFPHMPPPTDLFEHVAAGGLLEAWNVAFERWVWENVCVARLGWPPAAERQWRCAMAKARASALPGKLEEAGRALQLEIQKDKRGAALLNKLSKPRNPTKGDPRVRVYPLYVHPGYPPGAKAADRKRIDEDYTDTWGYGDYNATDIAAEAEISAVVPDLTGEELEWWIVHERINRRGVHMDRAGVENCIAVLEQAFEKYNGELLALTGIDSASKVQQLQGWLHARGVHLDSLDEETVSAELASMTKRGIPADDPARRVLEVRAAVGSASVKKLYAIRNCLSAFDRLHDLYLYHAARTGRSTGDGPQPTNLPKAGPETIRCGAWTPDNVFMPGSGCRKNYGLHLRVCPHCSTPRFPKPRVEEWSPDVAEQALAAMSTRSLPYVEYVFGDALLAIAGCLRALFTAAPGHDLISTDYNSIEAVGLAMISGEQWRIDVFNGDGKIYEASASTMFRVPYPEFAAYRKANNGQHHPLRQRGKIGELAFGYQGWLGAARAFEMPGSDDEIKADILAWRAASPTIEWLWGGQTAGKAASIVANTRIEGYKGTVGDNLFWLHRVDRWDRRPLLFGVEGKAIEALTTRRGEWCEVTRLNGTPARIAFLCDGDTLYCRLPSDRALTYRSVITEPSDRGGLSMSYEGWNTNPKNGPKGWIRMSTWGGRLVENIVQATCRDILRRACIALENAGYPVVLHVYDEIVAEVREGWGSIEEFEAIVTVRPEWALDWPIKAPGGYRARRYRKG